MALAGKGGSVNIGSKKVQEIANWSLDLGADDIEITSFDSDGWKEYLAGLKEWSGSIEGNFVADDTTGQRAILNAWLSGGKLSFVFQINNSLAFSGDGLVTPSIETPVDDKVSFSCDVQGTGPLVID
jgi:predicted secreted protein